MASRSTLTSPPIESHCNGHDAPSYSTSNKRTVESLTARQASETMNKTGSSNVDDAESLQGSASEVGDAPGLHEFDVHVVPDTTPHVHYRVGPTGKTQGPFTERQVQEWYRTGFFDSSIDFRIGNGPWTTLANLRRINGPSCPFAVPTTKICFFERQLKTTQQDLVSLSAEIKTLQHSLKELAVENRDLRRRITAIEGPRDESPQPSAPAKPPTPLEHFRAVLEGDDKLPEDKKATSEDFERLKLAYKACNNKILVKNSLNVFEGNNRKGLVCDFCDVRVASATTYLDHVLGAKHRDGLNAPKCSVNYLRVACISAK